MGVVSQAGWRGEVDGMLRELHLHKSGVVFQPDEADHEGKHLDDAVAVHYGGADKQAAAVVVPTPSTDAQLRRRL